MNTCVARFDDGKRLIDDGRYSFVAKRYYMVWGGDTRRGRARPEARGLIATLKKPSVFLGV